LDSCEKINFANWVILTVSRNEIYNFRKDYQFLASKSEFPIANDG